MNMLDPDVAEAPVVGLMERYDAGAVAAHAHRRAQLIYAAEGGLTVLMEAGSWVLPPSRALLLPGGVSHALKLRRPALFRTLYLDEEVDWVPHLSRPQVIVVPGLLRELIEAAIESPWNYPPDSASNRLARVLCDRLLYLESEPVHLPEPRDPRARRLAKIFYDNPAERQRLDGLCREVGASLRTMERLFRTETDLSIGVWIQQLRLMFALEKLADGQAVGEAAFAVGFENPSSFIALFKRHFGTTPAKYFA